MALYVLDQARRYRDRSQALLRGSGALKRTFYAAVAIHPARMSCYTLTDDSPFLTSQGVTRDANYHLILIGSLMLECCSLDSLCCCT